MSQLTDKITQLIEEELGSEDAEGLAAVFSALCQEIVMRGVMKECVGQLRADAEGDFDELTLWFVGNEEDAG